MVDSMFDCTLEEVMEQQKESYPSLPVPAIIRKGLEVLAPVARCTQGIFRISADATEIIKLEARIDKGDLSFNGCTPHEIGAIIKVFLKRLAEPVIPSKSYQECIQHCNDTTAISEIVRNLPDLNRHVLCELVTFLQELAQPDIVQTTKMGANNLALLFSPILLC